MEDEGGGKVRLNALELDENLPGRRDGWRDASIPLHRDRNHAMGGRDDRHQERGQGSQRRTSMGSRHRRGQASGFQVYVQIALAGQAEPAILRRVLPDDTCG